MVGKIGVASVDELFVDMIPHLANQRSVMRDLHQGQTPSGMAVHSHDGAKRVAQVLDQLSDEDLARVASTHVRLLWAHSCRCFSISCTLGFAQPMRSYPPMNAHTALEFFPFTLGACQEQAKRVKGKNSS